MKEHNSNQIKSCQTHSYNIYFLFAILLFQQFLAALTFPVAKFGLQKIEPFTFAFYRYVIASFVLMLLVLFKKKKSPIERRDYLKLIGLGIIIIPLNQTSYLVGQHLTTASHGALLFATVPIWIFIGALIHLKEKFIWQRAIGLILAIMGVALVMTSGAIELGMDYFLGDIIILISVISWSYYTILGRPLILKYGALTVTAYALTFGSLLYFPFGIYRALVFDYSQTNLNSWLAVFYVALGTSVAAYVLWYWLLKYMEASRIAVFHNIQPIIASLVAAMFLGEQIGLNLIMGGVVVIFGVIITELKIK